MKLALRQRAVRLRQQGWSYNIIASRLGVAKSTLSHWLREVPYTPNTVVRKRIREGPYKSNIVRHKRKMHSIAEARTKAAQELGILSKRDLWMIGIGLYMGEGSKLYESIRIINSDPQIIRLAVRWFREICGLGEDNFSIAVHLYPDVSPRAAMRFWSKVTELPLSKFGKTQIDTRTNKTMNRQRKLPYGTAHLTIKCCGNPEFGVLLHRRIMGWLEASYQQMRV